MINFRKEDGKDLTITVIIIIVAIILGFITIHMFISEGGFLDNLRDEAAETKVANITFKISDIEGKAEDGMTWEEFIESEYNTIGIIIINYNGNNVVGIENSEENKKQLITFEGTTVSPDKTIIKEDEGVYDYILLVAN